ncbi:DUF4303 domain-containing protein [Caldalkalibacillus mannanilyticus]|uniref:DUF4303 domain-containing protein n=1 Tax=Caldalkalibacillus mannanilyticus TaxID=1418 RepID=UPI0004687F4B|nr:DUF4303 domain-containing protein [Caldalkalibacillus mannanilyticus]
MEWIEITRKIYDSTKRAFWALRNSRASEDFYAYALYTDSSAMTVMPAANSVQGLERRFAEEEDKSAASLAYYKWTTSEWSYEAWHADEFSQISAELRNSPNRNDEDQFRKHVFQSMIEALKKLDDEGFFGKGEAREKLVLFITLTDDDLAEGVENESAKILNHASVYEDFVRRYESQAEGANSSSRSSS